MVLIELTHAALSEAALLRTSARAASSSAAASVAAAFAAAASASSATFCLSMASAAAAEAASASGEVAIGDGALTAIGEAKGGGVSSNATAVVGDGALTASSTTSAAVDLVSPRLENERSRPILAMDGLFMGEAADFFLLAAFVGETGGDLGIGIVIDILSPGTVPEGTTSSNFPASVLKERRSPTLAPAGTSTSTSSSTVPVGGAAAAIELGGSV